MWGHTMRVKILSLFIVLLLCFSVYASQQRAAGTHGTLPACTKDTSNLVYSQTDTTGGWSLASATEAAGQDFLYGSQFQLYSLYINFADTTNCVATVRIGLGIDLTSTYTEQWFQVNVGTHVGDSWHEFVSVDKDIYPASTQISVGVEEVSGTCKITYIASNVYADGAFRYDNGATTGWLMDFAYTTTRDLSMQVFKTEVTPCQ